MPYLPNMKTGHYILLIALLIISSCSRYENIKGVYVLLQAPEIRQRYGGEMGALADELKEAHVSLVISPTMEHGTAYYPSDVLPKRWEYGTQLLALRHELRRRDIRFAAYIPVFTDAYAYRAQPGLRAVNDYGSRNGSEQQHAVCPNNPEYQSYKLEAIEEVILILQPDIVYLDNLFFPVNPLYICPENSTNNIRSYCFCSSCLQAFQEHSQIILPQGQSTADIAAEILEHHETEWIQWKCETITSFMEKASKTIHTVNPDCKIMLSVLPWKEEQLHSGRKRLSGQDVKTLAPFVDYFTLLPCPFQTGQFDSALSSVVSDLQVTERRVIPSIEMRNYRPTELGNEFYFQRSLQHFQHNVIISDWGYLLKNRPYLNTFISEP